MLLRRYHENPTEVEPIDYSKLKVDELKELLNERKIAFESDALKADLIELLGDE